MIKFKKETTERVEDFLKQNPQLALQLNPEEEKQQVVFMDDCFYLLHHDGENLISDKIGLSLKEADYLSKFFYVNYFYIIKDLNENEILDCFTAWDNHLLFCINESSAGRGNIFFQERL